MVLPLYKNLQKLHKGLSANLEISGKKIPEKLWQTFLKMGKTRYNHSIH